MIKCSLNTLALVVGILLLSATPVVAVPEAPIAPEAWVNTNGSSFILASNKGWVGAKEISNPEPIGGNIQRPAGTATELLARVWANDKCANNSQKVSFRRSYTLYGVPTKATFQFIVDYGNAWKKNPVLNYTLLINGIQATTQKVTGSAFTLTESTLDTNALNAFRDGENLIEVLVERKKAPKNLKKCNTKKTDTRVGAQFRLLGEYATDIGLVEPAPVNIYRKASTDNSQFVNVTVHNRGPAANPGSTFHLEVCCPNDFAFFGSAADPLKGPQPEAPPFTTCETKTNGPKTEIDCAIGRWSPGVVGQLGFGFIQRYQSTAFSDSSVFINWRIGSFMTDTNYNNNQRSVSFVYCGTNSTKPECLAAQ